MEEIRSRIKDDNYIQIQGWMLNKLNLKNNELLIYAIIYGFSQDGESEFNGSLQYLADWCNCTKQGVLKCLKSLLEKDYIKKLEYTKNNIKFCSYKTNLDILTKFNSIKQSLIGSIKQSSIGIKQSLTNNTIYYNTKLNNTNIRESRNFMDYNDKSKIATIDDLDTSETF